LPLRTNEILEMIGGAAALAAAAAAALAYASVSPTSQLFGSTLTAPRRSGDEPDEIALTFDDGPNPRWTPQLLDLLAKYNMRATFFLMGRYAATQRALVRRTHEAGHLIGNHTWTHPNLASTSSQQTREELSRTSAELEQITGAPVRYFRPPFGLRRPVTLRIARELGLIPVTWNVIGNDWNAVSAQQITARVTRLIAGNRRRGYNTNLVLHDGGHLTLEADRSRTVAAARELLAHYTPTHRFVRLDEWELQKANKR
jgi:peptidoglycan/xylan/chitin deacetylase (PgdA/CDA1 family)